jgi:hypothetical protein
VARFQPTVAPTIDAFRFVDRIICAAGDLLIFRRRIDDQLSRAASERKGGDLKF